PRLSHSALFTLTLHDALPIFPQLGTLAQIITHGTLWSNTHHKGAITVLWSRAERIGTNLIRAWYLYIHVLSGQKSQLVPILNLHGKRDRSIGMKIGRAHV